MSELMPVLKEPAPKRKGSRKLLIVLFLLFFVILSVLFFNSSISKVSEISVEGGQYATVEQIKKAAEVVAGDAFFGVTASTIESRVKMLEPIDKVIVHKHFPGVIKIQVVEFPVVAFEMKENSKVSAILSNDSYVPVSNNDMLMDKPVLTAWKPGDPVKEELTKQLGAIPIEELSDLSEIMPYPSKAYPDRIKIYTRSHFEVVTAVSLLSQKIEALNAVIETQEPGKITMLLADIYVPFVQQAGESTDSEEKDTTQ